MPTLPSNFIKFILLLNFTTQSRNITPFTPTPNFKSIRQQISTGHYYKFTRKEENNKQIFTMAQSKAYSSLFEAYINPTVPSQRWPQLCEQRTGSVGSRSVSVVTDIQKQIIAPLRRTLSDMNDEDPAIGKDMKTLREDAASSIVLAWKDTRRQTGALTEKINVTSEALEAQLNASFEEVGRRMEVLPRVAVASTDFSLPRISSFTGSDSLMQFSVWLRRLEDVWRMRASPDSDEKKAYFLIGHLDGVAREKVDELSEESRQNFLAVVAHLRNFFESLQQKYIARQSLSTCRHNVGESAALFASKILSLVRAATAGQDPSIQKERALEKFISRLRADIRYYVKLDNPNTFEAAVAKAQTVEQLLAEATAERLINPISAVPDVTINAINARMNSSRQNYNESAITGRHTFNDHNQQRNQRPLNGFREARPETQQRHQAPFTCFNCGGQGHRANFCPSPRGQFNISPPRSLRNNSHFHRATLLRNNLLTINHDNIPNAYSSPRVNLISKPNQTGERSFVEEKELSDARNKIESLSLAFESTKSALEHSNSRIAALVQRNEDLAKSASKGIPSTSSYPHGCKYRDGYCSLKDGSLAIWTPEESEKCKYIFVSKMKGFLLGNVWLSDNKEFALSFNNNSPSIIDCSKALVLTDQGYAIAKLHITKRDTLYQVGLVTSNQFASQLLTVEGSIHSSVS
uniref:CCHC-type domain-containing protein n=1 Tax=Heterorhabditis bacteriophora TaxID=37862 RepID=A0A1I7W9Z0_HETBA